MIVYDGRLKAPSVSLGDDKPERGRRTRAAEKRALREDVAELHRHDFAIAYCDEITGYPQLCGDCFNADCDVYGDAA